MQKYIKIIAMFLILFFALIGCADEKGKSAINEREVDERTLEPYDYWYPDNKELNLIEEDKTLLKEKEEFLQLFKEFGGFSLPEYFFIPKVTEGIDWNQVHIDERFMNVFTYFVVKKNDALKMLEYLRNDDWWIARYGKYKGISKTQEQRNISTHFEKSGYWDPTAGNNGVFLVFIYNKDSDVYILNISACLERDPPHGTSWPELYFH